MIDTELNFAILPFGTGNDLYAGLYGKRSVKDQIDHIFKGKTSETDAIYIPELDLYTMNILSFGADANVVFQANDFKEKNKFLQKYAYMASIPKALQAGTAFYIDLTARKDGAELKLMERPYILTALCNGTMYGGGFQINPYGQVNDGLLELVYVQTMPMRKIWTFLYKFFTGNHEDLEKLRSVPCDEVVYTSKDGSPMIINYDGEIYQLPTFTCQVKKHAYKRII